MKRYIKTLSTLLAVSLFWGFASCNKDNKPQTLFSNLLGNWRLTATATDDNGSGIITPSEITPQPSSRYEVRVFKSDFTGYDTTAINNIPQATQFFSWYLNGDSLTIEYVAQDTPTYYIENINSDNLTLYINNSPGLAAYYYSR